MDATTASRRAPLAFSGAANSREQEPEASLTQQAHDALKKTFGFDAFRGRQLEAILAALHGRDSFVLMPTGGGKSLCYALVPAMRRGVVLVVSPLIALMEDQVQNLRAKGLRADYLSSTRTEADRCRLLEDLQQRQPHTQLLYVTPELLATDTFLRCLRNADAAGGLLLAAVDEAHAISQWGHQFRPAYRRLWALRRELPRLPLMALTATASERVQADIVSQLRLRDPLMLRCSFNRPNIAYEVRYVDLMRGAEGQPLQSPLPDIIALLEGGSRSGGSGGCGDGASCTGAAAAASSQRMGQQAQQAQHACLHQQPGQDQGQGQGQGQPRARLAVPCTVIYCHKREEVDRVAAALRRRGIACAAYHAGLPDATRSRVLVDWQARRVDVVAATVAFGMGIDRADVRCVVHYSLPKSLEAFYQESGRAGRDGQPSRSVLYYSIEDCQRQEYVLSKGDEKQQQRRQQQQQRQGGSGDGGGGGRGCRGREGSAGEEGGGGGGGGGGGNSPAQLQQFGQVVEYCLTAHCRRATVLHHFGERPPPPAPAPSHAAHAAASAGPGAGAAAAAAARASPGGAAAACCDVCADSGAVEVALAQLATAGAQRRQRFAGGKHALDFGCRSSSRGGGRGGGGPAAALEFETSRPSEGLDYNQERPSKALQESDDDDDDKEDAIEASSEDEEKLAAASAAMRSALRAAGGSADRMLAAMQRAEQQHEQEQAAGQSKRARLLQRLEQGGRDGGSGGGAARSLAAAAAAGAGGSGTHPITGAVRQAAARQLAAALVGNAALAAALGGSRDGSSGGSGGGGSVQAAAAAVATELVHESAAGTSKPVFLSKLSNLVMRIKKAQAASDVPALATALINRAAGSAGAACQQDDASLASGLSRLAPAPAQASAQAPQYSAPQLQAQVAEALRLAEEARQGASSGSGSTGTGAASQAAAAAAAALWALAPAAVTAELLQQTGAGKQVHRLRKHVVPQVAAAAAAVVDAWKGRLAATAAQEHQPGR